MQCCEHHFLESFETYKTFPRCISEFKCKVDVQNEFGWVRFQNRLFKLLNQDDEKYSKNSIVILLDG